MMSRSTLISTEMWNSSRNPLWSRCSETGIGGWWVGKPSIGHGLKPLIYSKSGWLGTWSGNISGTMVHHFTTWGNAFDIAGLWLIISLAPEILYKARWFFFRSWEYFMRRFLRGSSKHLLRQFNFHRNWILRVPLFHSQYGLTWTQTFVKIQQIGWILRDLMVVL